MDAAYLVSLISSIPIIGPFAVWLPVLVLICTAIDAAFPQPPLGSIWVWPRRITSMLAGAVYNAKNAVPAGAPRLATDLAKVAEVIAADARTVPADPIPAAKLTAITVTPVVGTPPA